MAAELQAVPGRRADDRAAAARGEHPSGAAAGERFASINPANGEVLGYVHGRGSGGDERRRARRPTGPGAMGGA